MQQPAHSTTRHSSALKLRPRHFCGLTRIQLVTMCILCIPPMPLGMVQQGAVLVVRDVLREREQIVSVCPSQLLYYRSAARIHQ
jgi:hypothetical protein